MGGNKKEMQTTTHLMMLQMNHIPTVKGVEKKGVGLPSFGKQCFDWMLRQKDLDKHRSSVYLFIP